MKTILIALSLTALVTGCATDGPSAAGRPDSGTQSVFGGAQSADASFASRACQSGVAEIELGKLAARNTRNQAVRALARQLTEDHAQAEKELAQLFVRKGIQPEAQLAPHLQTLLERLANLRGHEFDQAFKQQVIEDHEKAISLFEEQAEQGTDADLKAFAAKHLPHLRQHLAAAQRLELSSQTAAEPNPGAVGTILGNPATRGANIPR